MEMIFKDEITNQLYLAYTESKAYLPIDEFELIFEADEGGEAKEKKDANDKVKKSVIDHLKNALSGIAKIISSLMSTISNWLKEKSLDKDEREKYEAFKELCKADPSLKNKKITVKDYEKIKEEYEKIEKEAERLDTEFKAGKLADAKAFLKSCADFCGNASQGATVAMGMDAALNMAHKSRAYAQTINTALKLDRRIIDGIASQVGEVNAAKFEREIEIYTNRATIRRALLRVRGKMYNTTTDCFNATYKDAQAIFNDRLGNRSIKTMIDAHKAKQLGNIAKGNKEIKEIIDTKSDLSKAYSKGKFKGAIAGKIDSASSKAEAKRVAKKEAKGDYSQSDLGTTIYHDIKDTVDKMKKK